MPRPRTPTAVLKARGAFKNHPKRAKDREGEPVINTPLGDPPAKLPPLEKAAWRELQSQGTWLVAPDKFLVEVAVRLMARHRSNKIDNPSRSHLISALSKLGFNPTERSKIKLPTEDDIDEFADFK